MLAAPGCGSSSRSDAPLSFAGAPSREADTTPSGFLTSWRFSPPTLARGVNAAELTATTREGLPLSGWTVTVVPWMPAHAHGTSQVAVVEEVSPGVYVASPLLLTMGGNWELRTSLVPPESALSEGLLPEAVAPAFEVP